MDKYKGIEKCCKNCKNCKIYTTEVAGCAIFRCRLNKFVKAKDKVTGNVEHYKLCNDTVGTKKCHFEPNLYAIIKYNIYIKHIKEPIEARIENLRKMIISKITS